MNPEEVAARIAAEQVRSRQPPPSRGGGEVDALLALIETMRRDAAADPTRQREIAIGEFLVDGARVPLNLAEGLQHLTRTEAAALRFAGWGRSNEDIAVLLAVSEGTVRSHLNSVIRKLELDGMRALIGLAGVLFFPLD